MECFYISPIIQQQCFYTDAIQYNLMYRLHLARYCKNFLLMMLLLRERKTIFCWERMFMEKLKRIPRHIQKRIHALFLYLHYNTQRYILCWCHASYRKKTSEKYRENNFFLLSTLIHVLIVLGRTLCAHFM